MKKALLFLPLLLCGCNETDIQTQALVQKAYGTEETYSLQGLSQCRRRYIIRDKTGAIYIVESNEDGTIMSKIVIFSASKSELEKSP